MRLRGFVRWLIFWILAPVNVTRLYSEAEFGYAGWIETLWGKPLAFLRDDGTHQFVW